MGRKIPEIVDLLQRDGASPTERFWDAKERMDWEVRALVDCLDGHSRSKMFIFLGLMLNCGMIGPNDFEEFSEELRSFFEPRLEQERRSDESTP